MIDTHCHVLPGLDDGPEELEESLAMCEMAAEDGVDTIVAVAHMLDGVFEAKREQILDGVETLSAALGDAGKELSIYPAGEVYVQDNLSELIKNGDALTIADARKYVLVELPSHTIVDGIRELIFSLKLAGVTPIFCHIERNRTAHRDPNFLIPLVEGGAVMQITAHSLSGLFGPSAQRCAEDLVIHGLAHLVASDSHGLGKRTPIMSEAVARITELAGPEAAARMSETWPRRVLEGRSLDLPEPVPIERKSRSWFSFLFGSTKPEAE